MSILSAIATVIIFGALLVGAVDFRQLLRSGSPPGASVAVIVICAGVTLVGLFTLLAAHDWRQFFGCTLLAVGLAFAGYARICVGLDDAGDPQNDGTRGLWWAFGIGLLVAGAGIVVLIW